MFVINGKRLNSCSLICFMTMYLLKMSFMEIVENDEVDGNYTRRPFWNIAHMVNAIKEVNNYIDLGANSIECDISFDKYTGIATHTWHGIPCDYYRMCHRQQKIVEYLEYIREITSPDSPKFRKRLVLLFLDVKVQYIKKAEHLATAGEDLATKLLDHYWQRGKSGARAYILICIPSIIYVDFLRSFRNTLKNKSGNFTAYDKMIGYDFSGNENLDDTENMYKTEFPGIKNIWQGDGITNWCYRSSDRLRECVDGRERSDENRIINKVYYWTVDNEETMKTILRLGVDGIITNYPDRLKKLFEEDREYEIGFRLATIDDNPWEKYTFEFRTLLSNLTGFSNQTLMLRNLEDLSNFTNGSVNIINLRDDL